MCRDPIANVFFLWDAVVFFSYFQLSLIRDFLHSLQILELRSHPYYVGVQFHPEFKSRPGRPSALFLGILLLNEFMHLIDRQF